MPEMTGGCACGRIRYTVEVADDKAYLCHCRMCQRATGGVSAALKTVRKDDVRWQREPEYYASSPIARRGFCAECGTRLTFQYSDGRIEQLDLAVGTFDDPSGFRPTYHFGTESMNRSWLDTKGLPETRSDEYQPLVDRWMENVGKLPDQP